MTPEDLLPVLALALFAGLRGASAGRCVLCVLPVAWLAGGGIGLLAHGLPALPIPALSLLILGTLVAADLRLPPPVVTALAVGLGLVLIAIVIAVNALAWTARRAGERLAG